MAIKTNHVSSEAQKDSEDYGMLPMLHYILEEVNQGTTVFIDEGSNTSLITSKLVNSLYLKGKVKLTTVTKACEKTGETEARIHHEVELVDRYGVKHKVRCIKVNFITDPQEHPDYTKILSSLT